MVKRAYGVMLALLCVMLFSACGQEDEEKENMYQVYYLSNSETRLELHARDITVETPKEQMDELLTYLGTNPEKLEYKAPLSMGFQIRSTVLDEGTLKIDVDAQYKELSVTTEVLVRAAIVRTVTQLPEVNYVLMTVEGNQLYDNSGSPIGRMKADQFIVNDGNEINTYEQAKIKLYFATENGTNLTAINREKHYATSTSLERLVVEELIAGPSGQVEGQYPSVNPSTKILNITTKDGICYVNLDTGFLTVVNNVSTEVSIYSIVNSLVELNTVNKVQILINGEVPTTFTSSVYERNLDIVVTLEK